MILQDLLDLVCESESNTGVAQIMVYKFNVVIFPWFPFRIWPCQTFNLMLTLLQSYVASILQFKISVVMHY